MTVADTIYDTIVDNWGGGGYGGAAPTFASTEAAKSTDVTTTDLIEVRHYSVRESPRPVNDVYTDRFYTIDVLISSKTTAAQLKLLVDEAEYLLRNTAMTDLQFVNVTKDYTSSVWGMAKHAVILKVEVVSLMSSGAITPAAGTGTGLTGAYIADLLMFGSANAAWVPCAFEGGNVQSEYEISTAGNVYNTGAGAMGLIFTLPCPTTKGSLKLYVSGATIGVFDADGSNFVTATYILGLVYSGNTIIDVNGTNLTTIAAHQDTFTAVDCSSYTKVIVNLECVNPNAGNLDIAYVTLRCYYDT